MGVNGMFNLKDADLREMLDSSMVGSPLYVSSVVHKAVIEVNEDGTEAVASTSKLLTIATLHCNPVSIQTFLCLGYLLRGGGRCPEPIDFNVDHPFFFFIGSSTSSTPVFCGSVYKP